MAARKCVIHIGPPKTGTTAIREVLGRRERRLNSLGWLYPRSGRAVPLAGHQALVLEISRGASCLGQSAMLRHLTEEIGSCRNDVILASEAFSLCLFEYCLFERDVFAEFIRHLQDNGLHISVVVYLRNQADQLASQYLTYLINGCGESFEEFLGRVLAGGPCKMAIRGIPFCFAPDHRTLLNRLKAVPGIEIIVRSYDAAADGTGADFLSLLGLRLQDLGIRRERRANLRRPARNLVLNYVENRLGRRATAREVARLDAFVPAGGSIGFTPATRQRIMDRFGASDAEAAQAFGVVCPPPRPRGTHGLMLEEHFSAAFCDRVREGGTGTVRALPRLWAVRHWLNKAWLRARFSWVFLHWQVSWLRNFMLRDGMG